MLRPYFPTDYFPKMLLLGLTGDIACGKSTVARWLAKRGAIHLDADLLVRELYQNPTFARDLVAHLTESADAQKTDSSEHRVLDVLTSHETVDRAALAQWVFGNATRLSALETFVHPAVAALREAKIEQLRACATPPYAVVLEAVKLVESGQARGCDAVWWITATPEVQMRRLTEDRGLSVEEAALRLAHQPVEEQKRALLGDLKIPFQIIDNSCSRDDLERQLDHCWNALSLLCTIRDDS